MNRDGKACNGTIKGGAKSCPQKLDCKRFAVHLENPSLPILPVHYTAIHEGECFFKK